MSSVKVDVAVIGSGIAGLEVAKLLAAKGYGVVVHEKGSTPGGHSSQWSTIFPINRSGSEIVGEMVDACNDNGVDIRCNSSVQNIDKEVDGYLIACSGGTDYIARAVVVASGFSMFDARMKEELGYGIYPQVITSEDWEKSLVNDVDPFNEGDRKTFAVVHCVGSRDMKCGNNYCSKVCCMAGVKCAIELKKRYPGCRVSNFYMDLRMFDHFYEDLYLSAQLDYGVQFVRGRVSEISPADNNKVCVKAEDTLLGLPLNIMTDGVVLMTGMTPSNNINSNFYLELSSMKFYGYDAMNCNATSQPGFFLAGACKGPMNFAGCIADARSAAIAVDNYLNGL